MLTSAFYRYDILLVSMHRPLPLYFDSTLDDAMFEHAMFAKFDVVHPFFKIWFTSVDPATNCNGLIQKLSTESNLRPSILSELTGKQLIDLDPISLEVSDAGRDDQVMALFSRFEYSNSIINQSQFPKQ